MSRAPIVAPLEDVPQSAAVRAGERAWGVPRVTHQVSGGSGYARPFDFISNTAGGVQVTRCWYKRAEMWVKRTEEPALALTGLTDAVLCARVNLASGEVSLSSTPDGQTPAEDGYVNSPLYVLTRASTAKAWRVVCDVRGSGLQVWA